MKGQHEIGATVRFFKDNQFQQGEVVAVSPEGKYDIVDAEGELHTLSPDYVFTPTTDENNMRPKVSKGESDKFNNPLRYGKNNG